MNIYTTKFEEALDAYHTRTGTEGSKLRAALIDMDGTLYDSMPNHTLAWHRMMTSIGIPTVRDDFYLYEGMTGKQTINRLFGEFLNREATDEEVKELYHRKTELFNQLPKPQPMPGAAAFLSALASHGIIRVLVTGSGQRSLIDRLERDYPGIFSADLMITSANVEHGKPHPEPYEKAMRLAGVKPYEAMVVENAPLGVESGARSGAFTVGLTTGPVPVDALTGAGADLVLPSMQALAEAVEGYWR